MSRVQVGAVVFGPALAYLLVMELLAAFYPGCKWPTISRLCWDLEDWWPGFQVVFLVTLAALLVHIVSGLPLWVVGKRR